MSVVFDRPYQFIPPHRGDGWPSFIQTFRIVDRYLRRKEGVVSYECRNTEYLQSSLDRGDGIVLAPNHCRYADPLVLGWPARQLRIHLYAMASWHLFNTGRFDGWAIQKMGAFSIFREGTDRQSLETAIKILEQAERPLVLFPEGTTSRTNDLLKPLLEGVSFIARSAARRRAKQQQGGVVMHPVAIKYLCKDDFTEWADHHLQRLEKRLGWDSPSGMTILQRTIRASEGLLALKEVQYLGTTNSGALSQRRDHLIHCLLQKCEHRLAITSDTEDTQSRIRSIRAEVASRYFDSALGDPQEQIRLRQDVDAADLAQELLSYPDRYLDSAEVTDTRVVETIQRLQDNLEGKADVSIPLHAVIQFDEAIEVPAEKAPRGTTDPLLVQLHDSLAAMLNALSAEARPIPRH